MKKIILIGLCLLILSCEKDFLETVNPNAPDWKSTIENPAEWEAIIARQFSVIWHATQHGHAALTMAGMADVVTSSWTGYWMFYQTSEPRQPFINSQPNRIIEFSYFENFKVIGSVNDLLRQLDAQPGVHVTDGQGNDIREKLRSVAYFLRGMAYGNLALKYNQAQYVTEDISPLEAAELPFTPYDRLIDHVLEDLERAITVVEGISGFEMAYYNGLTLNSEQYIRLIRTLQAKYLLQLSRDTEENTDNNWDEILMYAEEGIRNDIVVQGDGGQNWWDHYKLLIATQGGSFPFARVDHRVIAAMVEGDFPTRFSDSIPKDTLDYRLVTDMLRAPNRGPFPPWRGDYHFSYYIHTRYHAHTISSTGSMPWILKAENDLMIAEALIHTGDDLGQAADLINNTRFGRGQMSPVDGNMSKEELLDAIMHERFVELYATNGGQPFYDRRRLPDDDGDALLPYSGLQPGTPRQYPVPWVELNVLGRDIYTF